MQFVSYPRQVRIRLFAWVRRIGAGTSGRRQIAGASRLSTYVVLWMCLTVGQVAAYFENAEVGPRARALGRTFVSVADDATALYWNPAGIVRLKRNEVLVAYDYAPDLEGVEQSFVAWAQHWSPLSLGLGWHATTLDSEFREDLFYLSLSRTLVQRSLGSFIAFGATLKLARVSVDGDLLDAPAGLRGSQGKWTSDVALLLAPIPNVTTGVIVRNLGRPQFDLFEGFEKTALENETEWGTSFRWRPDATLHFSRVRHPGSKATTHFGAEVGIGEETRLRLGVSQRILSAGLGLTWRHWQLDSAFESHDELGLHSSFSVRFGFGEERGDLGGEFDDF